MKNSDWKCWGLDLSPQALRQAKNNAQTMGLKNTAYLQQDLLKKNRLPVRGNIMISNEVFFINPDWRKILNHMISSAQPGTLYFCSWRPRLYYLAAALKNRHWDDVEIILKKGSGALENSPVHFSWADAGAVVNYLQRRGMTILDVQGIGTLSGLVGEPYESIISPMAISAQGRSTLEKIDLIIGKRIPDASRYFMICFQSKKQVFKKSESV
jgi:hypothetical protein